MFEGFLGGNQVNLDAKGRLAIPSCYREQLGRICDNTLVLTMNPYDPSLWLYPANNWESTALKLVELPDSDREIRRIKQMMLGYASRSVLDVQGRIRVPELLRAHAGLEKSITVLGQGRRFEIWDTDHWAGERVQWLERVRSGDDAVSEKLKELAL